MFTKLLQYYLTKNLNITNGTLHIYFTNNTHITLGKDSSLTATIKIKSNKLFYAILTKGEIGFAEGYIKDFFETDNIVNLLDILLKNIDVQNNNLATSNTFYSKIIFKIVNYIRQNSIKQSKKNISYHYDLGNNFYELWLDKTMTYSSALYKNPAESLEEAQTNKYKNILNILEEKQGKNLHILEIGCGFGGFAEIALAMGHKITGITLSKEQYNYANNRLKMYIDKGLCEILLIDYRNLNNKFDAVVSIEMFEAVGLEYWNDFFKSTKNFLKNQGYAVIQTIYIQDYLFKNYKNSTDFIRHYIFPGGFLPSNINFIEYAENIGLKHINNIDFGLDYEKTLLLWLNKFNSELENIKKLNANFNESFIKMWQYYLAYCSIGFKNKRISVAQFILQNK